MISMTKTLHCLTIFNALVTALLLYMDKSFTLKYVYELDLLKIAVLRCVEFFLFCRGYAPGDVASGESQFDVDFDTPLGIVPHQVSFKLL